MCSRFGFPSSFFHEKSLSKPINIGSSIDDLDARNPTMKAVRDLNKGSTKKGKTLRLRQVAHIQRATCRNLGKVGVIFAMSTASIISLCKQAVRIKILSFC